MRQDSHKSLEEILSTVETALGAVVFLALFGAVLLQVFFRYVLHHPLG